MLKTVPCRKLNKIKRIKNWSVHHMRNVTQSVQYTIKIEIV